VPRATNTAPRQRKVRTGEWTTINDTADALQVHPRTVRRWIEEGRLPAYKVGKAAVRLRVDDVEALIASPMPSLLDRR
jgi:excisionase family DNA binding protein